MPSWTRYKKRGRRITPTVLLERYRTILKRHGGEKGTLSSEGGLKDLAYFFRQDFEHLLPTKELRNLVEALPEFTLFNGAGMALNFAFVINRLMHRFKEVDYPYYYYLRGQKNRSIRYLLFRQRDMILVYPDRFMDELVIVEGKINPRIRLHFPRRFLPKWVSLDERPRK